MTVETIFSSARQIPPGAARDAFVREACGDDAALRSQVEALLSIAERISTEEPLDTVDSVLQHLSHPAPSEGHSVPPSTSEPDLVGTRIGHYEIIEKLGEGGMGVVYRARDTHLDRPAALKVLRAEKITNPERKKRFVQEAKAASALNHPNIVHLYDIDEQNGINFMAMEYVTGKTLDELIARDGMRLNEVLNYGGQIADALTAAHKAGIVHRDLKPNNIMVDDEGRLRILDFGLAKLMVTAGDVDTTETVGVEDSPMTVEGTILGTASYMSPEQAEGRQVDARSDIFSFGAVLYEMVSGHRAFRGDSMMSTLAAIIRADPEELPEEVPFELRRLVERCLRKDVDRRTQHMSDVRLALEDLKHDSESRTLHRLASTITQVSRDDAPQPRRAPPMVVYLAVVVLVAAGLIWFKYSGGSVPVEETTADAPVPVTSRPGFEWMPSFSPDGHHVAYTWAPSFGGLSDIYIQSVGGSESVQLTDTPDHEKYPVWSPDGRWIAFQRDPPGTCNTALMLISPFGRAERKVAEVCGGWELTWTPDSKFLVTGGYLAGEDDHGLILVSVDSGGQRRITSAGAVSVDWKPSFSPDGGLLLFSRGGIHTNEQAHLVEVTPGWNPKGEPRRIGPRLEGYLELAWTPGGKDIVIGRSSYEGGKLWLVDAAEKKAPRQQLFAGPRIVTFDVSKQGNRLIYEETSASRNIQRVDRSGNVTTILSSTQMEAAPQYSPDGKRVVFQSERSGSPEIWVGYSDGSDLLQLTSFGRGISGLPRYSPDGRDVVFESHVDGRWNIYTISVTGGQPHRLTPENGLHSAPSWSRDGNWIYYGSSKSDRQEVWRVPVQGGEEEQVTQSGGFAGLESSDGQYLYYTKRPIGSGLWRMALPDGEEEFLVERIHRQAFAVADEGVYYVSPPAEAAAVAIPPIEQNTNRNFILEQMARHRRTEALGGTIRYYEQATGKDTFLVEIERPWNYLSVSPDEQSFLYALTEHTGSDLMLVNNFK